MTPLDFARNLAKSDDPEDRAYGVAIVARGLSDDDPDTLRQGWPLAESIASAITYLGLTPTPTLVARATALAPTVSDAVLNKRAKAWLTGKDD